MKIFLFSMILLLIIFFLEKGENNHNRKIRRRVYVLLEILVTLRLLFLAMKPETTIQGELIFWIIIGYALFFLIIISTLKLK